MPDNLNLAEGVRRNIANYRQHIFSIEQDAHRRVQGTLKLIREEQALCPHPSKTTHRCVYESYDECDYCGKEL